MSGEGRRVLALSAASAALYGAWGALAQMSLLKGVSPAEAGLVIYLASAAAALAMARRLESPDPRWIAAGLLFMAANFTLFSLMKLSNLASAYVYVPSSVLVFFAITARGSPARERPRVAASVLVVVAGLALAQVQGAHAFNFAGLGMGLGIAVLYGLATYLVYASIRPSREADENLWVMLTEALAFLAPAALRAGPAAPEAVAPLLISGASVAVGFQLELKAYEASERTQRRLSLVNLVNAVTNLDIAVVALVAVALGSYSVEGLAALVMVFLGITSLYVS